MEQESGPESFLPVSFYQLLLNDLPGELVQIIMDYMLCLFVQDKTCGECGDSFVISTPYYGLVCDECIHPDADFQNRKTLTEYYFGCLDRYEKNVVAYYLMKIWHNRFTYWDRKTIEEEFPWIDFEVGFKCYFTYMLNKKFNVKETFNDHFDRIMEYIVEAVLINEVPNSINEHPDSKEAIDYFLKFFERDSESFRWMWLKSLARVIHKNKYCWRVRFLGDTEGDDGSNIYILDGFGQLARNIPIDYNELVETIKIVKTSCVRIYFTNNGNHYHRKKSVLKNYLLCQGHNYGYESCCCCPGCGTSDVRCECCGL